MLSIIVCGRQAHPSSELLCNLEHTVGVPFELIHIDNSQCERSIQQAYAEGAQKANFPNLCFCHDDIQFENQDWGKNLLTHLCESKVGIIGVAGSHFQPDTPAGWWTSGQFSQYIIHSCSRTKKTRHFDNYNPFKAISLVQAITLDGVFLGMRRETWLKLKPFPLIPKFHGYDTELSLQAIQLGLFNFVAFDILTHHSSEGSFNRDWLSSVMILHNRWTHILPLSTPQEGWSHAQEAQQRGWAEFLALSLRLGCFSQAILHMHKHVPWKNRTSLVIHPRFIRLFFWHLIRRVL